MKAVSISHYSIYKDSSPWIVILFRQKLKREECKDACTTYKIKNFKNKYK